ncbi:MAG: hypothetical protein ACYC0V_03800 [Armatimonadota bacterium]
MKSKIAPWMMIVIILGVFVLISVTYWWYTEPDRRTAVIEKTMADMEKNEEKMDMLSIPGVTPAIVKKYKPKRIRNDKSAEMTQPHSVEPIPTKNPK